MVEVRMYAELPTRQYGLMEHDYDITILFRSDVGKIYVRVPKVTAVRLAADILDMLTEKLSEEKRQELFAIVREVAIELGARLYSKRAEEIKEVASRAGGE